MKLQSSIITGARIATVCGLALATGFLATRAKADDWDKKTVLTVKEPIQITDTYLQPGTYVLMLDRDSQSNRHIVRIYNDKQDHLINTILAIPAYRVRVTGSTQFTFWETPPGSARAMRDWFWPGDNFGQEFPYPKNVKQVAQVSSVPSAPAPQVQEQPAPQPQAEVQEQPAPEQQAEVQEQPAQQPQAEVQEEVIVAQATPPPAPPAPEAQSEQAQSDQGQPQQAQPQQLPQTASPFPLVGLIGLSSLGLYGLLRAKRLA